MKRRKSKPNQKTQKKSNRAATPAAEPSAKMNRRDLLAWGKFAALGVVVIGGGSYYLVSEVRAGIREADLSKIGNGTPAIVQVHDPSCPSCRALQGETREALENFEDGELQYLVADLNSDDGRKLAAQYGVGRVTLLLFDGRGRMRDMIQGRTSADVLRATFKRHVQISTRRPSS
jgi:thiol-disulfide isomerase/thioredoxin